MSLQMFPKHNGIAVLAELPISGTMKKKKICCKVSKL